ncbi:hypothetical protein HDV00_005456 [Rhizophlyctis rosea]|nr:hypothetical protein HDV00_005456 [Rhizophlyctis rosea]
MDGHPTNLASTPHSTVNPDAKPSFDHPRQPLASKYSIDLKSYFTTNNIPFSFKTSSPADDEHVAALYIHRGGWVQVGLGVGPTVVEAETMAWICAGANFDAELGDDEFRRKKVKLREKVGIGWTFECNLKHRRDDEAPS